MAEAGQLLHDRVEGATVQYPGWYQFQGGCFLIVILCSREQVDKLDTIAGEGKRT